MMQAAASDAVYTKGADSSLLGDAVAASTYNRQRGCGCAEKQCGGNAGDGKMKIISSGKYI